MESLISEKLSQGYRFVDIDTFVAAASRRWPGRKLINVSFDDGYQDVLSNAYPILKRYQIPFTLYVATDMPDGKADLWWLQLEKIAKGDAICFERLMSQIVSSKTEFGKKMHRLTSTSVDLSFCEKNVLSWQQLAELASDSLCTIGSHGVSHKVMTLIPENRVRHELVESKRRLENKLNVRVSHFSYPYSCYSQAVNELVWEAGYSSAVIGYGDTTRHRVGSGLFYRRNIVQ
ncbi:MAG: polysaccharide deacetylase family protein [Bacteroidales bacterium]|nr:polysaccharide deacetylase family protein [Bacteroidales bacterium]